VSAFAAVIFRRRRRVRALGLLTATTFAILFLMTGSVVLPIKALLMNVFTLTATFGTLVLVFQDDRLQGVLDYVSPGGLQSTQPVLLAVVAFGLATDYGVFLFCVTIGAFATSSIVFVELLGLGTALAVAIDATVVRALLVPALMALLGRRTWWAPAPLRRLHARIGRSEAHA
jgi:RND superfamily putative drug exporter